MKTQSKIITVTLLCGAVILLLLISQYKSLNTHGNTTDKSRERLVNPAKVKRMPDQKRANPEKRNADKDTSARRKNPNVNRDKEPNGNADFYRVIVENNLFRPLGWQKPNREPQYTLIATLIESEGNTARAFLMDRKSNQSYYVAIGEKVGDAIVKDIKSNQVTLNKVGNTVTIRAEWNPFLSSSSRNSGGDPTLNRGNRSNQNSENSDSKKLNLTEIKRRLQNASPEERQKYHGAISQNARKPETGERQSNGEGQRESISQREKRGKIKPETRGNNQYEK